jgi:hypothetical protein
MIELLAENKTTIQSRPQQSPIKLNVRQMYNTRLNINKKNKPIQTMVQRVWIV